mgnify:FL=1|tara:strand:- start:206 stop:727 length:522 start_codon:yes stop_codon:yes gene_type:complete
MSNFALVHHKLRASQFFIKKDYLSKFLDDSVDDFFTDVKDTSLIFIRKNIDGLGLKKRSGRLRKFNKSKKQGDGLESRVTVWNAVRNNTGKKQRVRYARFIEFGRPKVTAKNPTGRLTFPLRGRWMSPVSVRAVSPKPFFFPGIETAIETSSRDQESRMEKKFIIQNRMMRKF